MTTRDTAADHLARAKAELVASGWRQGMSSITDENQNTCCVMEAIERTRLDRGVQDLATLALCAAVYGDPTMSGYCEMIHWNDLPGRTQAEVEAAYDKAIIIAKEQNRAS